MKKPIDLRFELKKELINKIAYNLTNNLDHIIYFILKKRMESKFAFELSSYLGDKLRIDFHKKKEESK
jgi:hypothetical protein